MGKPERKARERICSSSSYFLRCFGISRKIHSDKPMVETGQGTKKMRSRWFFRPTKFRLKRKPIAEDDKQNLFREIRQVTDRINIAAVGHETKEDGGNEQRDINLDPLSFLGHDTCHKHASTTVRGGKLDPIKTVGSGSKPKELKEKSTRVRRRSRVGRSDQVIGILIIMLTLMIMLMWGRLCAILCTFAWFYFLPRLRQAAIASKRKRRAEGRPFPVDLDFNSQAYKKKVVLEGFLVRQNHVSL